MQAVRLQTEQQAHLFGQTIVKASADVDLSELLQLLLSGPWAGLLLLALLIYISQLCIFLTCNADVLSRCHAECACMLRATFQECLYEPQQYSMIRKSDIFSSRWAQHASKQEQEDRQGFHGHGQETSSGCIWLVTAMLSANIQGSLTYIQGITCTDGHEVCVLSFQGNSRLQVCAPHAHLPQVLRSQRAKGCAGLWSRLPRPA